ncbi:tetratricopeptide repeat protein [Thalassomonas sp. RHCl1]|uniref:tetratricopeptide repeat protein n=1 Tax=Thalassomonas sp. RHCl1 TaxID=2995320 RepID=UPI00248AC301|nr:tetratricopeptide repeat protein [Thalassomonas sp. RHCl1]
MSVINQMLNDLQQRERQKQGQDQQASAALTASAVVAAKVPSSSRNSVLAVLLTLISCGVVFFLWQLSNENQLLKQTLAQQVPVTSQELTSAKPSASKEPSVAEESLKSAEPLASRELSAKQDSSGTKAALKAINSSAEETMLTQAQAVVAKAGLTEELPLAAKQALVQVESSTGQEPSAKQEPLASQKPAVKTAGLEPELKAEPPRLAISRKKVSADELVRQKWLQAEQAINSKQLALAEELLEDILLLQPGHEQGRKQLAALWFGRQAYQAAINVLAQGISLAPDNQEFRLMQAKIYLSRGLKEKAYQVLQVLAAAENNDYLAALANAAQQTGRYQQASELYLQLTRSQPTLSRWWLGLGVAHDSNSRFDQAISAYRYALETGNLSMSSSQFARQRLQQLGG